MAIVNDDIRFGLLVWYNPQPSHSVTNDFAKEDWAPQIPMAKQSKAKERVGDPFGEEDSTYTSRYVCERVTYASNNDILEDGCVAGEGRPLVQLEEVSLAYELSRKL